MLPVIYIVMYYVAADITGLYTGNILIRDSP